jgi:hypothetical protein
LQFDAPELQVDALQRVKLPLHEYFWFEVARPGFFRHIIYEEFAAMEWSLESRILRGEHDMRVSQVGDKSSAIGAWAKGRSSVWAMNAFCKRVASLQLAANLRAFWLYSRQNPEGWSETSKLGSLW